MDIEHPLNQAAHLEVVPEPALPASADSTIKNLDDAHDPLLDMGDEPVRTPSPQNEILKEQPTPNQPSPPENGKKDVPEKPWYKKITKKQWIIIGTTLVILIAGGTVFALTRHTKPAAVKPIAKAQPKAPPTVIVSPLTGLPTTAASAKLPVTGVMIENSDGARPQSGLSNAGIVFEAIAEGGITRFLALYQSADTTSIGPVRSARPYYIDALLPFDAAYAHVGGSPDALSEIPKLHVKDLTEFTYSSYYTRITSREAPHNVYTSTSRLVSLEKSKGWTTSTFTGFPRKKDAPVSAPTAATINFDISTPDMSVAYKYDQQTNSYDRSEGGAPMTDANTNKPVSPKVVIAMVVPWSYGKLDASGAYYTNYSDIGSGTAYIFQDGTLTQGTWTKSSTTSQVTFTAANGSAIKLNAGQTWITAVGHAGDVTYKS